MLSIVIPTLNAADGLTATLDGVGGGLNDGGESQILVADGGSTDATLEIARNAGAVIVSCQKGRGNQLAAGAQAATGNWLLFVHADTVLQSGWQVAVNDFIKMNSKPGRRSSAAVFKFQLDDNSFSARVLEVIVKLRTSWLGLPYGDQGLLISKDHYDRIGGFQPIPIMEDVDIIRRIGRRHLQVLKCNAITSASRYRREGYLRRMLRNITCLSMWFLGIAPDTIVKVYR